MYHRKEISINETCGDLKSFLIKETNKIQDDYLYNPITQRLLSEIRGRINEVNGHLKSLNYNVELDFLFIEKEQSIMIALYSTTPPGLTVPLRSKHRR